MYITTRKHATRFGLLLAAILLQSQVYADKQLDNSNSLLTFQSIKKGQVIETHRFKTLSGTVSDDGDVTIKIDLASVDTKIPIRDERMRNNLFETGKFTTATLTAKLDKHMLETEGLGRIETDATLDLHGVNQTIRVHAQIVSTDGVLIANSAEPVIINAADFKLDGGIETLRELAQLSGITLQVPVSFNLVFR